MKKPLFKNFKKMSQIMFLLLFVFSSEVFSAYQSQPLSLAPDVLREGNTKSFHKAVVSEVILSYKDEPLCVADALKYSSLVPTFWSTSALEATFQKIESQAEDSSANQLAQSYAQLQEDTVVNALAGARVLPKCGIEEMNRIYKGTHNSVLIDEQNQGVQVAMAGISYVSLCVLTFGASALMTAFFDGLDIYKAVDLRYLTLFGSVGLSAGLSSVAFLVYNLDREAPGQRLKTLGKGLGLAGVCGLGGYYTSTMLIRFYEE